MGEKIEIPERFRGEIASCEKARSGQARRYGPYEEVYEISLNGNVDKGRVLEFCQECCHRCEHDENQMLEIKSGRDRSFEELMNEIVKGWYELWVDADGKTATYKWSQDYLD